MSVSDIVSWVLFSVNEHQAKESENKKACIIKTMGKNSNILTL